MNIHVRHNWQFVEEYFKYYNYAYRWDGKWMPGIKIKTARFVCSCSAVKEVSTDKDFGSIWTDLI